MKTEATQKNTGKVRSLSAVGLVLIVVIVAGSVKAATITWGPATDDTLNAVSNAFAKTDVKTNGTFVAAVCNGSGGTVNGVTFTGPSYTAPNTTFGSSPISFAWSEGYNTFGGPGNAYGHFGYEADSPGTATNLLLTGGGQAGVSGTWTLSSLVIGNQYQVQVWAPTWNNTFNINIDGNPIRAGNEGTAPISQYRVGTFIADSTTQTFMVGVNNVNATAVSLRFLLEPPTGLTVARGGAIGSVILNWTGVSQATAYNVKRSTTTGTGYVTIGPAVSGTNYTDTTAQIMTNYYYVVSSTNSAGESGPSGEVSITLPPPGTVITIH